MFACYLFMFFTIEVFMVTTNFTIADITNRHLSIRHWRFCHIRYVIRLIKIELENINQKPSLDGRIRYTKFKHKELFKLLALIGFFDYHQTNNGFIILNSQVIFYIHKGWRDYREGGFMLKDESEIHHLDHNSSNDNPNNLVKVTPYENKMLATCVKGGFYLGKVIKEKISDITKFIKLITQTQVATISRLAKESFNIFTLISPFQA